MPSTRRNRTRALLKGSSAPYIASASASSSPLRPGSEESDDISIIDVTNHKVVSWQDLRRRQSDDGTSSELDDPMDYKFQSGDKVWVRTQENNWRLGKVVKSQTRTRPLTRTDTILTADYYQVQFGINGKLRKYFAPLNGEMKPDDRHVRELLLAGGWISPGDSEELE